MADELSGLIDDLVERGGVREPAELWPRLVELGLPRIGIDEDRGGSGGSVAELVTVVSALGRHGVSSPIITSAVADGVLARRGVLADPSSLSVVQLGASESVGWASWADRIVRCDASGTAVVAASDATIEAGVDLAGDPLDRVSTRPTAFEGDDHEWARGRLALLGAAALTGAAEGAFVLTRGYVAQREQFGAPLLALPAVSRSIGFMRVQLVQAEAALAQAVASASDGRGYAQAVAARVVAATVAGEIARLAHQLHGAMGVTVEYPLHRFTRRLWAWRDAFDDEQGWTRELGRLAGHDEASIWDSLTAAG